MLAQERLDAVFIVVGYDSEGRPLYPRLATDCLNAGCHVWMEKPPAASCREVEGMMRAAGESGKQVMVGLKKMFLPANQKARALAYREEFGRISLLLLQYPQLIPTREEMIAYTSGGEIVRPVVGFLDHLCHPASLLLYLLGMPDGLYYERGQSGAGAATFTYASGTVASLAFTHGASKNAGMERTTIVSDAGRQIVVDNNVKVSYHRDAVRGYGDVPDFYVSAPDQTTAYWEPEFSLGQLYSKGLFLLGYYAQVNEFARSILEHRPPALGTLEQAWQVTRIFEAFLAGPSERIPLAGKKSA
jgi:predicted dehydrogenase